MIVRLSPVLPKTRVGMSPAFNCEACAREAKLLLADASPAKMLPTNILLFIPPPHDQCSLKQAIALEVGNQERHEISCGERRRSREGGNPDYFWGTLWVFGRKLDSRLLGNGGSRDLTSNRPLISCPQQEGPRGKQSWRRPALALGGVAKRSRCAVALMIQVEWGTLRKRSR